MNSCIRKGGYEEEGQDWVVGLGKSTQVLVVQMGTTSPGLTHAWASIPEVRTYELLATWKDR